MNALYFINYDCDLYLICDEDKDSIKKFTADQYLFMKDSYDSYEILIECCSGNLCNGLLSNLIF